MGDNDPKIVKELKGPILNLASPQPSSVHEDCPALDVV